MGGNNLCHCVHVNELTERVDKLEKLQEKTKHDPLQRDSWGHPNYGGPGEGGSAGPR